MSYLLSPRCFSASLFPSSSTPSSFRFSSRTRNNIPPALLFGVPSRIGPNSMSHSISDSAHAESSPIALPDDVVEKADDENKNNNNDAAADVDVLVQYVVIRRDLIDTWPLGSLVTQGCHASVSAIWPHHKDDPHTLQYCSPQNIDSMHKVTLEVKGETQIVNLSEKLTAGGIAHKLWIEQPENTPTCLATKPYPKSMVSSFFKRLKLCK